MVAKAGDNFLLKNPHKELKGETIEVAKIPQYEGAVKYLEEEYRKAKEDLDKAKKGTSGKAKGEAGRALAKVGDKGRKARMRLEVAKAMKAKNISKAEF